MALNESIIALAAVVSLSSPALANSALADPAVGLGLSFSFGGEQPQTGIRLRIFSDDTRDSFVASVGVDYMLGTQALRGTVGGAYLGSNTYIGLDMGLNFNGGGVNFGVGAGWVGTKAPAAAAPAAPPGGGGVGL